MKRCRGLLYLQNIAGLLVRRPDGFIHGYCNTCKEPVTLKRARLQCNRVPERKTA